MVIFNKDISVKSQLEGICFDSVFELPSFSSSRE